MSIAEILSLTSLCLSVFTVGFSVIWARRAARRRLGEQAPSSGLDPRELKAQRKRETDALARSRNGRILLEKLGAWEATFKKASEEMLEARCVLRSILSTEEEFDLSSLLKNAAKTRKGDAA